LQSPCSIALRSKDKTNLPLLSIFTRKSSRSLTWLMINPRTISIVSSSWRNWLMRSKLSYGEINKVDPQRKKRTFNSSDRTQPRTYCFLMLCWDTLDTIHPSTLRSNTIQTNIIRASTDSASSSSTKLKKRSGSRYSRHASQLWDKALIS